MIETRNTVVNKFEQATITGFPKGVAVLSYYDQKTAWDNVGQGTIVLTEVWTPMDFQKGQRLGLININGRNTPIHHAMGGEGLIYPSVHFTLRDKTHTEIAAKQAHKTTLAIAGWCDAGVPLFFMFDEWIRQVIIASYSFQQIRYHTWYTGELILHKYEPISPLKYQRTLVDLAPFPELPNPVIPKDPEEGGSSGTPGNGSGDLLDPSNPPEEDSQWLIYETNDNDYTKTKYYIKKKEDGNLDCIEYVIQEDESLFDIINKYYPNLSSSTDRWAIYNIIVRVNKDKRGINLPGLTQGGIGGDYPFVGVDSLPNTKKRICLPRTVKYVKGTQEIVIEAKG